jgi:hypothetical protein
MLGRTLAACTAMTLFAGCGSSSSSSGGGSSGGSSSSGGSGVSLSVAGAAGNLNATACGKQEAFYRYAAPAQIRYSGTVSPAPSGRWKVKVKLKRCAGGSFVDADSQKIVGQNDGRFDGVFPVPAKGAYSLRARLESGTRPESSKLYVQVGG